MSNFLPKKHSEETLGLNHAEELICGLCTSTDDDHHDVVTSTDDLPRKIKRQRKSRSKNAAESYQKFTAETLFNKRKECQATFTSLAFKPCCSKTV